MNKKLLYMLAAVTLIGAGSFAALKVKAVDSGTSYPPIIQKLVDKFKLNPEEVKQVFDEQRSENQVKREAKFKQRLNQAVTDGKITEDEKSDISAKLEESRIKTESFKNLSPEERKIKIKELRDELIAWAKDKNIDGKFMPMIGKFGHGFKMGYEMGQESD